jgi:hypothetical protein
MSSIFRFAKAKDISGKKEEIAHTLEEIDSIESLKEICRICDKKKDVECPRCFVHQELYRRGNGDVADVDHAFGDDTHVTSHIHNKSVIAVEEVTLNSEGNGSDGQNQPSKKFFSEMLPSPLRGCYPEGTSYINVTQDDVTPEKHKSSLDDENERDGKSSYNQIKISEKDRVTSTCVSGGNIEPPRTPPYKATKQDTLTIYTLLEDLDETDCWIIHYLQQGKHQAEIARILNLSRKTISVRVKKLVETKLAIPTTLKPIKYKLNSFLVRLIRSKLFGIKQEDKNVLGGVEDPQPEPPSRPKNPSRCLLDVHHIAIKFQYRVNDVTSDSGDVSFGSNSSVNLPHPHQPRLACQSCPKFQDKFKHPGKCRCKKGRFTKMKNWVYFATFYKGYEISSNPSTIMVKGIKVSGIRRDAILTEAVMKAERTLSDYFSRWMDTHNIIVDIYWDLWELAGKPHWAINHPISQEIQHSVGGTLRVNLGNDDYLQIDSSPDEYGNPQNHLEYAGTDLEKVDRLSKLLNGDYDFKLSAIEQTISNLATVAAGGYSTQTIVDIINSGMRNLKSHIESRISRIESEFESLKNLVTSMREELQQLILEGNGKHIREINTALQTMAALWLRMDRLESKLQELRSSFSALENDTP